MPEKENEKQKSGIFKITKPILDASAEAWNALADEFNSVANNTNEYFDKLLAKLREDNNVHLRYSTIAVGGLVGLTFGIRGRKLKKVLYITLSGLSAAAMCYPEQAGKAAEAIGHGIIVAYHKINSRDLTEYNEKRKLKKIEVKDDELDSPKEEFEDISQKFVKDSKRSTSKK